MSTWGEPMARSSCPGRPAGVHGNPDPIARLIRNGYNSSMSTERRPAAKNDHRDQPAYGLAEATCYLKLPPATLRAWTLGRPYPTARGDGHFPPLIRPASHRPPLLSFSNLIEAHVLRALRTEHGVSVKAIREAARFAERTLQINRLLLSPDLRTKAGDIFLDRYGELINLSASGQLALRHVLEAHLKRVVWEGRLPIRLHPFVGGEGLDAGMPIAIDPRIAFGRRSWRAVVSQPPPSSTASTRANRSPTSPPTTISAGKRWSTPFSTSERLECCFLHRPRPRPAVP